MSSTNRGAQRMEFDYYRTPHDEIIKFLKALHADVGTLPTNVLDPCAGGNMTEVKWQFKEDKMLTVPPSPMAYPTAMMEYSKTTPLQLWDPRIYTNDIRPDSPAETHHDFLATEPPRFGMVISNPPFALAIEFIKKSLEIVERRGMVIMLLRANFFGSNSRHSFFQKCMPEYIYFHSNRMSFTPDGKKDSVEYVHAVWLRGSNPRFSNFRILDY